MLKALPIYSVEKILVCRESAASRGLSLNNSDIFRLISKDEIKIIYSESDTVIRF